MKPIIATTLVNLFVDEKPWKEAHKLWFYKVAHELNDESFFQWIEKENYFEGVDNAMEELMPNSSDFEKTVEARKRYFAAVIEGLKKDNYENQKLIDYFLTLKESYRIALITTVDSKHIKAILDKLKMLNVFDIIETTIPPEKDDSSNVFERFLDKYGKPVIYLGTSKKSLKYCSEHDINSVYVNFYDLVDLEYETIYNLEELNKKILEL